MSIVVERSKTPWWRPVLVLLGAPIGGFVIGAAMQYLGGYPLVPEGSVSWGATPWGGLLVWLIPLAAVIVTGRASTRMIWAILASFLLVAGRTAGAVLTAIQAGGVVHLPKSVTGVLTWWVVLPLVGVLLARLSHRSGWIGDVASAPLVAAAALPGVSSPGIWQMIAAAAAGLIVIVMLRPALRARLITLVAAIPFGFVLYALSATVARL